MLGARSIQISMPKDTYKKIFLLHFLFVLLVQLENTWSTDGVAWLDTIFSQFENYILSIIFCVTYFYLRFNRMTKSIFYLVYFASLVAISLNQVFYKIFREQFAFSHINDFSIGNISNFWGSFSAELGSVQLINFSIILIAAIYFVPRDLFGEECVATSTPISFDRSLITAGLVPAIIFGYFQFGREIDLQAQKINSHLFVTALRGITASNGIEMPAVALSPEKIYQLKYGIQYDNSDETQILKENLKILQQRKKNVIFIVLESVGSKQLFNRGVPRENVTPFLYKQKYNSIVFDNLLDTFPGTARSHVALTTGGQTMTWGSVWDELLFPYVGQTLASSFGKNHWSPALFSAQGLNYENLDAYYVNSGFDVIFDPDTQSEEFNKQYRTFGWGVDEKIVLGKAIEWIKGSSKPFFLTFLTVTTHHPYGTPEGFKSPFRDDDNLGKYESAMFYTDSIIESLVVKLEENNLAKDTLIFIVGDHGEAFGNIHKSNFIHKNYLYEENIRNYLMIIDLERKIRPLSSRRRGSVADIMPTILDSQEMKTDEYINGQSLFSDKYVEKIAYFHKNSTPEQWGLRDGSWKFIIEKNGKRNPELYNLDLDPDEKINLVNEHRDRVDTYVNMISNWFVYSNDEFTKRLEGFRHIGNKGLSVEDVGAPGPKRIALGRKPKDLPFFPIEGEIHPEEELTVWTNGPSYPVDVKMEYVFISPSGKRRSVYFEHDSEWSTVYLYDIIKEPREEGLWSVELFNGKEKVISTDFTVSRNAKLHWSFYDKTPGIRELYFGVKPVGDTFRILKRINPYENMAVLSQGIPFGVDKTMLYTWTAPSGKKKSFNFTIRGDWDNVWVFHNQESPMGEGLWRLELSLDGKLAIDGTFQVSKDAPLNIPLKLSDSGVDG
jgi:phosphoglycerol transferase MdoB-like AlkP superfamily enzyme